MLSEMQLNQRKNTYLQSDAYFERGTSSNSEVLLNITFQEPCEEAHR
jgi:hypothetical protein